MINQCVQDRHVGYLFQNYALFPNMTVEKNIAAGFQYRPGQKMTAEEIKKQTADYMELLHVTELKSSYPRKLSGGQQQRLCIARALAFKPDVLLMDEPTSALDPGSTMKVEELMNELKKNYTVVIVTHNMQQAARISDRTAFFLLGELVEVGPTNQIFSTPRDKRTEDYISGRFG